MEIITNIICTKKELIKELKDIVVNSFFSYSSSSFDKFFQSLQNRLDRHIEGLYYIIEYPYVDKVYRDSYYTYFSSKHTSIKRDCIRISIFNRKITIDDFRNNDYSNDDDFFNAYKGFFVIRPTFSNAFGRSVISPSIVKRNGFEICTSTYRSTLLYNKFKVIGFPHSSQDTETISCAETTLWALMEYFSSKYQDYTPILPSKILNILDSISTERMLPSNGLTIDKLSYALRKFNLGSIIYSKKHYKELFFNILSCYINSGIPLILAIEGSNFGHALLSIGKESFESRHIELLKPTNFINTSLKEELKKSNINIYDLDDCRTQYVFIDDNYPPYQKTFLDEPSSYYNDIEWNKTKITHFITPLHQKVYLEAYKAKNFFYYHLFISGLVSLEENENYYLRIYLTSSRSYKDGLAKNNTFNDILKESILEISMPKFIWICEVSNKELIIDNKAFGLVILDATEPNTSDNKSLIFSGLKGEHLFFGFGDEQYQKYLLTLHPFSTYKGNLQQF